MRRVLAQVRCYLLVAALSLLVADGASGAAQADIDAALVKIAQFEAEAEALREAVASALETATVGCTLSRACGSRAMNLTGYAHSFTAAPSGVGDALQSKIYIGVNGSAAAADTVESPVELCAAQAALAAFQGVAQRHTTAGARFQYLATPADHLGVYPARQWSCAAAEYTPTQRPYYTAIASQPKTLIIMVDVSGLSPGAVQRKALSIAAVAAVLRQLGPHDYFSLVPFSDTIHDVLQLSGEVVRASATTVATTIASLNATLALHMDRGANLLEALQTAYNIIAQAQEETRGAPCEGFVYLVASGRSDFFRADGQLVEHIAVANAGIPVLVQQLVPSPNSTVEADRTRLVRVACASGGLYDASTTTAAAVEHAGMLTRYVQALAPQPAARWTDAYTDAFGNGRVYSVGVPVSDSAGTFSGVVVIDVAASQFAGVNETELNAMLENRSHCIELHQHTGFGVPIVSALQGGMCNGIDVTPHSEEILWVVRNRSSLIFFSLLVPLMALLVPFAVQQYRKTHASIFYQACLLSYMALWVLSLAIFWSKGFDNLVEVRTFRKVQYRIDRVAVTPFRCCKTESCQCTDALFPTCSSLQAAKREGYCNRGFKCCRNDCRPCYCVNNSQVPGQQCRQCCGCGQATLNEMCDMRCGTCFAASADLSYTFDGQRLTSKFSEECKRDDTACAERFQNAYTAGRVEIGHVNPRQPATLVRGLSLNTTELAVVYVAAAISIIPYTLAVYIAYFGSVFADTIPKRKTVTVDSRDDEPMSPKEGEAAEKKQ